MDCRGVVVVVGDVDFFVRRVVVFDGEYVFVE